MRDCRLCEYKGYSPHLCKMHLRHMAIEQKQEKNKQQRLSKFDKAKAIEIIKQEEREKQIRDTSMSAAIGAAVGSGGSYAGAALLGGAIAAQAVAGPLILGAAIAGAGIGAAAKLHNSRKSKNEPPPVKKNSMACVFDFTSQQRKVQLQKEKNKSKTKAQKGATK